MIDTKHDKDKDKDHDDKHPAERKDGKTIEKVGDPDDSDKTAHPPKAKKHEDERDFGAHGDPNLGAPSAVWGGGRPGEGRQPTSTTTGTSPAGNSPRGGPVKDDECDKFTPANDEDGKARAHLPTRK